ncbi:MAG: hypothetical protein RIR33_3667 [Pseudomonadota bacterium]|jgi:hypothetical protein
MQIRAEDPNIIYEIAWVSRASTALTERGPSTRRRPFEEGPVLVAAFDDGVNHARHLGGNGGERLALEIGVVSILRDVALALFSKAVLLLANGDLSGLTVLRNSVALWANCGPSGRSWPATRLAHSCRWQLQWAQL